MKSRDDKKFRMIAETSPVQISLTRASDGLVLFTNKAFDETYGYKKGELLGHYAPMLYVHARDRQILIHTLKKHRVLNNYILLAKRKDGTLFYVSVSAKLIKFGGEDAVINTSIDITHHKHTEEKLRETSDYLNNLLNYANAPIICWDTKLKITKFNHAFERLTSYHEKEVIGKNLELLFPAETKEIQIDKIKKTTRGEYWQDVEIPIRTKSGVTRILLWNSANIYANDGKTLVATIAQGHDITDRIKLEKQKDEFINIASHELKTPLTSIKAFTQILRRRLAQTHDKETCHMLSRMEGQIDRLTQLVVTMLDVTKIQSGKLIYRNDVFNINHVVKNTVDDVKMAFGGSHQIKIKDGPIMKVKGDRYRISQVVANFLTNAIKYSPDADKIIVKLHAARGQSVISVRDYGIGVPKDKQPLLFEKFFRMFPEQRITSGFTSLGLGLYISAEIIKRHGGKIWMKSAPRQGSTFYFSLPQYRL